MSHKKTCTKFKTRIFSHYEDDKSQESDESEDQGHPHSHGHKKDPYFRGFGIP